jgi:hypothetical protein
VREQLQRLAQQLERVLVQRLHGSTQQEKHWTQKHRLRKTRLQV